MTNLNTLTHLHGDFHFELSCSGFLLFLPIIVAEVVDVAEILESSVDIPDAHCEIKRVGDQLVLVLAEVPPTEFNDAVAMADELL